MTRARCRVRAVPPAAGVVGIARQCGAVVDAGGVAVHRGARHRWSPASPRHIDAVKNSPFLVAGAWKEGPQKLVDQANMTSTMPPVDLNRSGMSSSQNGNGLTGTGRRLGKRTRV